MWKWMFYMALTGNLILDKFFCNGEMWWPFFWYVDATVESLCTLMELCTICWGQKNVLLAHSKICCHRANWLSNQPIIFKIFVKFDWFDCIVCEKKFSRLGFYWIFLGFFNFVILRNRQSVLFAFTAVVAFCSYPGR
jgi:hypothetical protein